VPNSSSQRKDRMKPLLIHVLVGLGIADVVISTIFINVAFVLRCIDLLRKRKES
jgi:hypothetical protein